MRLRTSHAAKSGVGEHTARESECAQRMRWERARGKRPPPYLAPEPKGSGALFFFAHGGSRALGRPTPARARREAGPRDRRVGLARGEALGNSTQGLIRTLDRAPAAGGWEAETPTRSGARRAPWD